MSDKLSKLLGIGVVLFGFYTIILVIQVLFGIGDKTWGDIMGPVLVSGGLFALIVIGHYFGDDEEEEETQKVTYTQTQQEPKARPFEPLLDKIEYTVYRQTDKTWWNDSDGDYHEYGTYYAHLRFFEDGTVIGNRRQRIPHLEDPDSFSFKGSWTIEDGKVSLDMERCSDIDESIDPYISPEDNRNMKYAGHISDNNSLIDSGKYDGKVREGILTFGNHLLYKMETEHFIITAEESTCNHIVSFYRNHPLVISTFGDTGNWYTNGETGPEWFTANIYCGKDEYEAFKEQWDKDHREQNWSFSNTFWS